MFAYLYNFQINRHQKQLKHLQWQLSIYANESATIQVGVVPHNTTITSLTKKSRLCQKMKWLIKTRVLRCCCSLAQSYCKTKQFWKKCEIWSLLMAMGMQKCKTFYQLGFFSIGSFKDNVAAAAKTRAWPSWSKLNKLYLVLFQLT